ncbi:SnoaL-like domain protein, partial [Trifolium medium]|nr:SnoaL-like domain protein [Trifolium medium]
EVCCVHPGLKGISGYDDVIESWNFVWANYEFPLQIKLEDIKVHARGDMGYVTCMEFVKTKGGRWGGQFVTNVFEKIDGEWTQMILEALTYWLMDSDEVPPATGKT